MHKKCAVYSLFPSNWPFTNKIICVMTLSLKILIVLPLPRNSTLQVYFIKYTPVKFKYASSSKYTNISVLVSALFQDSLGLN